MQPCLAACPNDPDIYSLESKASQSLVVTTSEDESVMVTVVHPASGNVVDTQTGSGDITFSVPAADLLVRVELVTDNDTDKLGAQYSFELIR